MRAPLPEQMSRADLVRYSKRDFQAATTAFYKDDWARLGMTAKQLIDLGQRWQEQPKPKGKEGDFARESKAFQESAQGLESAAGKKEVVETTLQLRKLASQLAVLERMPAE